MKSSKVDYKTKYRPKSFKGVVGQDVVVESLREVLKRGEDHAFLLVGPSGVGKTTLARIIAKKVGCSSDNLVEVDAASCSGVDATRELVDAVRFFGFGKNPSRVVVVDEAHALSKTAWQSLLKPIEEPPEHVYWIFCTTEFDKVPATIKTRCLTYHLRLIPSDDIFQVIKEVADRENLDIDDGDLDAIARASFGSLRDGLSILARCCGTGERVSEFVDLAKDPNIAAACRAMLSDSLTWKKATKLIKGVDVPLESVRHAILGYMGQVALNSDGRKAQRALWIMEVFDKPFYGSAAMSTALLSFGEIVFSD